jgi:putative signal transducing protein
VNAADFGDWDVAAEVGQIFEAELMALRLREAGIEAQVIDQSYRQEPMPSVRALALVRVLVPAGRAEEARRLLAERRQLPDDPEFDDEDNQDGREAPKA